MIEAALVTGGAGFLGSHVSQALLDSGRVKVVILDDLSSGYESNVPEGAQFVRGSVVNVDLVRCLFDIYKFSYVFHLGAHAAEAQSHFARRLSYESNVLGSAVLIDESVRRRVECFVYTSSIAVYGYGKVPNCETDLAVPIDPYGISKLAVELDLAAARRKFGLTSIIFRPHNVYGERQDLTDPNRNVVGTFMGNILRDEPLRIFGDGEQRRAFTYATDVAGPIAESPWTLAAYHQTLNVGSDSLFSVNQLAKEVCKAMGVTDHPVVYAPGRDEALVAGSDHGRFRTVFRGRAETTLAHGLMRMATWAKSRCEAGTL